jgi:hypothetical protein
MAKHEVHTDPSGKHTWTAEGGHCACGGAHATTPLEDVCPAGLPVVVLRCRCGKPEAHAEQGAHCPAAEVDALASYEAGVLHVG